MFLDEHFAIAIRNHWEDFIKLTVPSVTRLAVRPHLMGGGGFAGYYLEIGVLPYSLPIAQKAYLDGILAAGLPGPAPLGAPGPLTVVVVRTGKPRPMTGSYTWTGDVEPVRGGHRVAPLPDGFGTLGCLVRVRQNGTVDYTKTFFLSCWHVLSGPLAQPGDTLEWRRATGSPNPSQTIGSLYWSMLDDRFDVALGLIENTSVQIGKGFAWSRIGACPKTPASPNNTPGPIVVCGQMSQASGTLQSTSVTLYVDVPGNPDHKFTDQIATECICQGGDSGALLFLDAGTIPIGMACCNDDAAEGAPPGTMWTYYNNLSALFSTTFRIADPKQTLNGDGSLQIDSIIVDTGLATPTTATLAISAKKTRKRKKPKH